MFSMLAPNFSATNLRSRLMDAQRYDLSKRRASSMPTLTSNMTDNNVEIAKAVLPRDVPLDAPVIDARTSPKRSLGSWFGGGRASRHRTSSTDSSSTRRSCVSSIVFALPPANYRRRNSMVTHCADASGHNSAAIQTQNRAPSLLSLDTDTISQSQNDVETASRASSMDTTASSIVFAPPSAEPLSATRPQCSGLSESYSIETRLSDSWEFSTTRTIIHRKSRSPVFSKSSSSLSLHSCAPIFGLNFCAVNCLATFDGIDGDLSSFEKEQDRVISGEKNPIQVHVIKERTAYREEAWREPIQRFLYPEYLQ